MVITIIVLLILAGVALATLTGQGSIIGNAENVVGRYNNGVIVEQQLLNEIEGYLSRSIDRLEKIPVYTEEQLQKMGTGEDVIINGRIYNFGTGKTYVLQNNIEYTGTYENIGNLIKNKEIYIEGQNKIIKVTNEEGIDEYYTEESKYYIATNKYGYVLNGLELYYDGIDNTGTGEHSLTTTTWKDLSGNNRDGTLIDFGTSTISGWGNNYLSFDGINDWVNCGELNNTNITFDICYLLKGKVDKSMVICGDVETGGSALYLQKGKIMTTTYIGGEYKYVTVDDPIEKYNITTSSYSYDGNFNKVYKNGEEKSSKQQNGDIGLTQLNTVMAIGANPYGSNDINRELAYIDVYTVRIYNRGLSAEEIEINSKADERRYKQENIIPVYTEEQLLKAGTGEDVYISEESKTYNYAKGAVYELKNDVNIQENYTNILNRINNREINIKLNDKKIIKGEDYYTSNSKYTVAVNKYGYVKDGLELYYDGIDNTGSGHSTTVTTWTDLSGKGRNGTLKNNTSSSAWTEEGLVFDGIDDYVLIQELNYDNVTLETVIESNRAGSSNAQVILGNLEQGGYGIYYTTRVTFEAYIKEENDYATPDYKSNMPMNISQGYRYSISGCYNGKRVFTRLDGQYQYKDVDGTIKMPERNTKFILGGNPYEETMNMDAFEGVIYSTRVYSRALSDEEMSINYLTDKERYNL